MLNFDTQVLEVLNIDSGLIFEVILTVLANY